MSGNVFFNPIPSDSQWLILIPIPDPRFSLVLFPFPPALIPIQVDIFCQFIAALLLIVFGAAEFLKVEDTRLLAGGL